MVVAPLERHFGVYPGCFCRPPTLYTWSSKVSSDCTGDRPPVSSPLSRCPLCLVLLTNTFCTHSRPTSPETIKLGLDWPPDAHHTYSCCFMSLSLARLCPVRRTCILSRSAASCIMHRPALDDLLQVALSKALGEEMALEEEAERGNGHCKRSTLDHQLTRREGVFPR